jgi:phage baseplate assembly protein W
MADTDNSFIGTGWSFPPRFSRALRSVAMVSGDLDIQESLFILLSTTLGERVMLAAYGSQINQMVFQALNNSLTNQLIYLIRQAILQWEPRITVNSIDVSAVNSFTGYCSISIIYTINQTNTRSNMVYPFYMQEATIPLPGP